MTKWQRTVVSLAGPFANLVLAVLLLGAGAVLATPSGRCSGVAWRSWGCCR